ncbi:MAG: SEC-C metal-binding domain-containing protein [Gemmatimonadota bacterium]
MSSTPGRNDPCPCGSGKKYKQCCQGKGSVAPTSTSKTALIAIGVVLIVGLVLVGISLFGGSGDSVCPPGTVWSADHQHCH